MNPFFPISNMSPGAPPQHYPTSKAKFSGLTRTGATEWLEKLKGTSEDRDVVQIRNTILEAYSISPTTTSKNLNKEDKKKLAAARKVLTGFAKGDPEIRKDISSAAQAYMRSLAKGTHKERKIITSLESRVKLTGGSPSNTTRQTTRKRSEVSSAAQTIVNPSDTSKRSPRKKVGKKSIGGETIIPSRSTSASAESQPDSPHIFHHPQTGGKSLELFERLYGQNALHESSEGELSDSHPPRGGKSLKSLKRPRRFSNSTDSSGYNAQDIQLLKKQRDLAPRCEQSAWDRLVGKAKRRKK